MLSLWQGVEERETSRIGYSGPVYECMSCRNRVPICEADGIRLLPMPDMRFQDLPQGQGPHRQAPEGKIGASKRAWKQGEIV